MILFEIDMHGVERALRIAEDVGLTPQDWEVIGQRAVVSILERTEQGRGPMGTFFTPYAPRTARLRARKGRKVNVVTLAYTGRMMASLTSTAQDGSVRLSFTDARSAVIAAYHQTGTKHMPARPFLEVLPNSKVEYELSDLAANLITADLRRKLSLTP